MSRTVLVLLIPMLACVAAPVHAQDAPAWGGVKGRLVWGGKEPPPEPKPANGQRVEQPPVVNPKNLGVRYGLVYLMPVDEFPLSIHPDLKQIKPKERSLVLKDFRYHPAVLAIREGQNLLVQSKDTNAYDFQWIGHPLVNPGGMIVVTAKESAVVRDLKAQKLPLMVGSNLYDGMKGHLGVFNHPYFAVTDEDGRFEILQAPVGPVRVMIWTSQSGWLDGRDGQTHSIPASRVLDLGEQKWKQ